MSPLPPAQSEKRALPVGGPKHYPVNSHASGTFTAKTCFQRGWHCVRVFPAGDYRCTDCGEWGNLAWAQVELRKQGDFLLELGHALEDLAKAQIREHRTIFDSQDEELNKAAQRAGGKEQ